MTRHWYRQCSIAPSAYEFLANVTLDRLRDECGLDDEWHIKFMRPCHMDDSDLWIDAADPDLTEVWGWAPFKSRVLFISLNQPLDWVTHTVAHECWHARRQQQDDRIPSPAALRREEGEADCFADKMAQRMPWEWGARR